MRQHPQTTVDQVEAEQLWAYRARWSNPLVPIRVLRIGVRRPPRVLVRFVADEFEGLEDWVPPARLKCHWDRVQEFREREARWEAVTSQSEKLDEPLEAAASVVFDVLLEPSLATMGYGATAGVSFINDLRRLATFLDEDPGEFQEAPSAFVEDGTLIVPWSATELIARRAVTRDPHAILRYVEREEHDARREAIYGRWYRAGRGEDFHTPPEACAQLDERHGLPVRAILREWAGQEPMDLRHEIAQVRAEVARQAALAGAPWPPCASAGTQARRIAWSVTMPFR